MLELTLFGTFQLLHDQKPVTSFRSDKVRALLAYLAVESDRSHQRTSLATMLWSEHGNSAALKNLRTSLSNLRKAVGDDSLLVSRQLAQIKPDIPIAVDVATFERLLVACEIHPHQELLACPDCIGRMRQAAEQYRGDFLGGLSFYDAEGFSEWRTIQQEALHNQALRTLQTLIEYDVAQQDYVKAQRSAQQLLTLSPWSEIAYRGLMRTAAYRGDRSSAVAYFEQCKTVLWDELGVEPDAETQTLIDQIKTGVQVPAQKAPANAQRPRSQPRHNLPRSVAPLFGRKTEIDQLSSLTSDANYPLVSIVGAGGIGKTRLSLATAQNVMNNFADGVWFVPLEAVESTASMHDIIHTIASEMDLALVDGEALTKQLVNVLRYKEQLIIFDNCEQLLENEQVIELVQLLLQHSPDLHLLITSRQPLQLQAEYVLRLEGLSLPDSADTDPKESSSVQLFIERAQRIDPQFEASAATLPTIVKIVQSIDGIPLAIELAATGLLQGTLHDLAKQLNAGIDVLSTNMRDVPKRHRTMRAVFDYSWRLLTPAEQTTLMQLTLFRGDFSAEACAAATSATPAMLANLVGKSFLKQNNDHRQTRRFQLMQSVRHYVAKQAIAQENMQLAACRQQHADYYLTMLANLTADLHGSGQLNAVAIIDREYNNIRQAWKHILTQNQPEVLLTVIEAFAQFFDIRSWYSDGSATMAQAATVARAHTSPAARRLLGKALAREGWFRFQLGKHQLGHDLLAQGLVILDEDGFSAETTFCYNYLSAIAMHLRAYDEATEQAAHALKQASDNKDTHGKMIAHNLLGRIHFLTGNLPTAQHNYNEGLTLAQQTGNRWSTAFSLDYLGQLAAEQQSLDEAQRLIARSLAIRQQMNDQRGIGLCYVGLGNVAQQQAHFEDAQKLYEQALAIFTAVGNSLEISRTQNKLDLLPIHG